jgi:RNA polymerase sigma-70 factor (ECF subfamily)
VAEQVETSLEAQRVRKVLNDLTAAQREAVSLAYFGGYTHSEVAELLHIPLGTVKTRIRDGLIRLRDALGVTS